MIGCKKAIVMNPPLETVPLTFTRVGETYGWDGRSIPEHTPIYEHKVSDGQGGYKIVPGCGVFESRTNILPAAISQSMSTPYTTAALTGTYTFMVQGEGSITLSGGATGTISFNNPVTVTLSNATVTLTPTGTVTLVQVINKAYPLPWGLGGVSIQAETLTAPSSVLNIDTNGYSNLLSAGASNGSEKTSFADSGNVNLNTSVEGAEGGTTLSYTSTVAGVDIQLRYTAYISVVPGQKVTVSIKHKENFASNVYVGFFAYQDTTFKRTALKSVTANTDFDWDEHTYTVESDINRVQVTLYRAVSAVGNKIEWDQAQVSITDSSKPWILGGTQVNGGSGTVEGEFYWNGLLDTITKMLWYINYNSSNRMYLQLYNGSLSFNVVSSGISKTAQIGITSLPRDFVKYSVCWDKDSIKISVNGGTPVVVASPTLLAINPTTFNLGSTSTPTIWLNTIMRNIIVSRSKRADADTAARGSLPPGQVPRPGPGTMLYAPLMNSLKAYKVRA